MTSATAIQHEVGLASAELRARANRLIRTEVEFIPNREFAVVGLQSRGSIEQVVAERPSLSASDLSSPLRRLCSAKLLSQEEEAMLFREMNLLKFQANVLRSRLDADTATEEEVVAIESRLQQAQAIRDRIIEANMRLVMSIVKKFASPQQPLDEVLSDGIVTLMHAVEKFDFARCFRFSTYAYRSIARNVYRAVMNSRREEARFARDGEEWALEQVDRASASATTDQVWDGLRARMASMLDRLDRREQFVIRSRYALGAHRKVRTFQFLAGKLGVSKERVRQIEQRAVGKLRAMADELEMDELFGAAFV